MDNQTVIILIVVVIAILFLSRRSEDRKVECFYQNPSVESRVRDFERSIGILQPGESRQNYRPLTQQEIDILESQFQRIDPEGYAVLVKKRQGVTDDFMKRMEELREKCKDLKMYSQDWWGQRCDRVIERN